MSARQNGDNKKKTGSKDKRPGAQKRHGDGEGAENGDFDDLPKLQLWVVRVPRPEEDAVAERLSTLEIKVSQIDQRLEVLDKSINVEKV